MCHDTGVICVYSTMCQCVIDQIHQSDSVDMHHACRTSNSLSLFPTSSKIRKERCWLAISTCDFAFTSHLLLDSIMEWGALASPRRPPPEPRTVPLSECSVHGVIGSNVLGLLEEAFVRLSRAKDSTSLLKRFLTQKLFDHLKRYVTSTGANLLTIIQPGVHNLQSEVGVYVADVASYTVFAPLLDPIIYTCHSLWPDAYQPATFWGTPSSLKNLDPSNRYIISTRVRCCRSLLGFPFNPRLKREEYQRIEALARNALYRLPCGSDGTYHSLADIKEDAREQLVNEHVLFPDRDKYMESGGARNFWPIGRGVFFNGDKTLIAWVNEEEHLRVISQQEGGNLPQVYLRLVTAMSSLESMLEFAFDGTLGHLTMCPKNLGTALRASVQIRLPRLARNKRRLAELAARHNLRVRQDRGEHVGCGPGVFDLSNRRRLGLTEFEAVQQMQEGVLQMIKIESQAPGDFESWLQRRRFP